LELRFEIFHRDTGQLLAYRYLGEDDMVEKIADIQCRQDSPDPRKTRSYAAKRVREAAEVPRCHPRVLRFEKCLLPER